MVESGRQLRHSLLMIDAVLFDLDETLLDRTTSLIAFLRDQYSRYGTRLGSTNFPRWRDRFLALDSKGYVHKSIVYPAVLTEFRGDTTLASELLEDYRENCCRFAQPFPGMLDVLASLRANDLRLGIVTNGETSFQSRHIEALGLDAMVDAVVISELEGLRKPERALFERAAHRLGVSSSVCLFVGDNPSADILGAHDAGMSTAWFNHGSEWPTSLGPPPGAVIESLEDVLGLVDRHDNVR